ncbi:alpha/beta fold hydrolase [Paraburkholderia dilworthii]|uniref:Alpha/beta fold hydrolase n=1 Tax=Paraburkholderia dilworthii TaxID=948106 RepID=A0ABW9D165_9BURK
MALAARQRFLLLPGTLCDDRIFDPLRETLGRFGQTVDADYADAATIEAMAEAALLSAGPEERQDPLIPVGVSMGGIVALEILRSAPARIGGLILFATNPAADTPAAQERRAAQMGTADTEGIDSLARQLAALYASPERNETDPSTMVREMARNVGIGAFRRQADALTHRRDYRGTLPSIAVPTLVIGGAHDAICTPRSQSALAAQIPTARYAELRHAGHLALLDAGDDCRTIVADWLEHTLGHSSRGAS